MKKALTAIIMLFAVPGMATAQDHYDEETDVLHLVRLMPRDRFVWNTGMCSWADVPAGVELSPWSIGYGGHWYWELLEQQHRVNIAIGLGMSSRRYRLNAMFHHKEETDSSYFAPSPDSLSVERYRHSTVLAELPVELRFKTKRNLYDKSWKLALGFKLGWALSNNALYIGKERHMPADKAKVVKEKRYDMENLQRLNYGVYARIAYSSIGLYFAYSLSPFFETGKGTVITPVAFGLSIILFH